jgi:hypothetical protein
VTRLEPLALFLILVVLLPVVALAWVVVSGMVIVDRGLKRLTEALP